MSFRHTGIEIQILGYGFELGIGFFGIWRGAKGGHRWIFPWTKTRWFQRMSYTD
jgi:hypothetical protein